MHRLKISTILELLSSKDCTNFKNIRPKHLKYMLIFPLTPLFANMQDSLFSASALGLDAMTLIGSAYCIGAGLLFAFTAPDSLVKLSRILALCVAILFTVWSIIGEGGLSLALAILFAAGLGGCAALASFAYTFALNNTERLIGAACISLFFSFNQIDFGLSLLSGSFSKLYITLLVIGSCICLSLYRSEDFSISADSGDVKLNPPLMLTLFFFVAHYISEIFYTYMPGASSQSAMIANGTVGIIVVVLVISLQLMTKRSVWNMCNLFFIAMITTYALYFLPDGSALRNAARFVHGFEQIGYIASYYLLGCVFKKHGNFRLFKLCVVVILPLSMLSYLIPGAISAYVPRALPLIATLTTSLMFIAFILLSPNYSAHLFCAEWSDDFSCTDMDETLNKADTLFEKLGLSPRECETAAMLLQGKNAKQIAAELNISTNTVNFHIKNLYKKLGIGSRAELFAMLNSSKGQ